ncbi:MAG: HAMP domain-containing histidine kinase [Planctomycetaceae bacterium]|nr:HAMP domain-containing histidine kinase [Planctomycetaceae bacterium]
MAGLTHESRNALARSRANLRRLSRRLTDQPQLLELIEAAIRAQEDLGHLFEEVRQYAAPVRLHCQMTNVGQLIDETWELLALAWKGRAVRLVRHDDGIDLECEIDRFHIKNAIRNILENSLAACEDPVEIDIQFSDVQNEGCQFMQIVICDNGPGFTPDQAQNVFNAFYTTKTHGTGLGLSITKRLIERHGGQVTLGSDCRQGAEIILTLPRSHT